MSKPSKANFKRGCTYYRIVNNLLRIYIDGQWHQSCWSVSEFLELPGVEDLSKQSRRKQLKSASIFFLGFLLMVFAVWVIR